MFATMNPANMKIDLLYLRNNYTRYFGFGEKYEMIYSIIWEILDKLVQIHLILYTSSTEDYVEVIIFVTTFSLDISISPWFTLINQNVYGEIWRSYSM